jgi:hypothetical protein
MLITVHKEKSEGPAPTLDELKKVWNLLREYERRPSGRSECLPAALREVRGMGEAV